MKQFICTFLVLAGLCAARPALAQRNTVTDGDWGQNRAFLQNTPEAEFMFRIGDIDNLGFGFAEGFDPFCGRTTDAHDYPWDPREGDLAGMDRIMLGSSFDPDGPGVDCIRDGYSYAYSPATSRPVTYTLDISAAKGKVLKDAFLQVFIDDFQAPSRCTHYTVKVNDVRFVEAERVINALEQGGPVGKLITLPIPEDILRDIERSGKCALHIDETTGGFDGWAIDFVKLILNRKLNTNCIGSIQGFVKDRETMAPIVGARVTRVDGTTYTTDAEGSFWIKDVPAGLEVVSATAAGYDEGNAMADIGLGDDNPAFEILLGRSEGTVVFEGKTLVAGQSITLYTILFDLGSATLRTESKAELDKLAEMLRSNPAVQIELSGHTSSEGDAAKNRVLSYSRVKACKDYVVAKGIETARIQVVGRGPDQPVAPNDTEANRALNRRVEMRVLSF